MKRSKILFIATAVFLLIAVSCGSPQQEEREQPNFIVFIADYAA